MSLVKNKDVIKFFDTDRTASVKVKAEWPKIKGHGYSSGKIKCTCFTQAAIKVCRANCDSTENNKINYDR
jgi:hypothetical protein